MMRYIYVHGREGVKGEKLTFNGVSFMIIGSKIFHCQHGLKAKSSTQKVQI